MTGYPKYRPRRMRKTEGLRKLVREARFSLDQLIMPCFIKEGHGIKEEIGSMPGQYRFSIDRFLCELEEFEALGLEHILLFGIPDEKDTQASGAPDPDGVIQRAIREIKKRFPRFTVITDVCLCEYMSHGHCGVVEGEQVMNDATLPLLARTALSHARAGVDVVAPSDMMDGRIGAIRTVLDEHGFSDLPILSYAAKYASSLYGPFRDAAQSGPQFGDRKSYQMDPANVDEALREIELDLQEGADLIMVKPALPYLDVIRAAREKFKIPLLAYHVSGEYAMVKAAHQLGYLDERKVIPEILTSIIRAGANAILTYAAKEVTRWAKEAASHPEARSAKGPLPWFRDPSLRSG
ncbi:MAG: delta-aminolevulinic acid dehydratase [Omnitrophica bacterium RIFCSPLOWO2_12_FULL_50_11]|nr:MAG: delta-aminolevulinic acid dehydratase [Omnitrophica bacterium RIFCSPLOWO2_12_FULL_50_11]